MKIMTSERQERDRCRYCGKEIVLYNGTTETWIHVNTGKSDSYLPRIHNATPRSGKAVEIITSERLETDYCRYCNREIAIYDGDNETWIHVDTNKRGRNLPMVHNATPRSLKYGWEEA